MTDEFAASMPDSVDIFAMPPHAGQMRVLQSVVDHDVTVLSPGRQWGKSTVRPYWIVQEASRLGGFTTLAYVGPFHSDAKKAYDEDLFNFGRAGFVVDKGGDDQDRHIDYRAIERASPHSPPDGCFDCRVASMTKKRSEGCRVYYVCGGPEAHRAFQRHRLDGAFVDEDSHEAPALLDETIFPMFNTTGGHLVVVGTPIPEGINFVGFSETYNKGDRTHKNYTNGWNSIRGSSFENPYAQREKIQARIDDLLRQGRISEVRCWYYGEFVTEMGAVFGNLDRVFSLPYTVDGRGVKVSRQPKPGEAVVVGIDLGAGGRGDPTIVSAISEETLEQLALLKIDEPNYFRQIPMVDDVVKRFHRPRIWCEGRESGAMFKDYMVQRYGEYCRIVKWTSGGEWDKNAQVNRGMDLCQQSGVEGMRGWRLIDDPEQKEEFRQFSRTRTPTGNLRYAAPEGKHDDHVAANLYAAYGLRIMPDALPPPEEKPPVQFSVEWMRMVQGNARGVPMTVGPGKMPL